MKAQMLSQQRVATLVMHSGCRGLLPLLAITCFLPEGVQAKALRKPETSIKKNSNIHCLNRKLHLQLAQDQSVTKLLALTFY